MPVIQDIIEYAQEHDKPVHLMGLLSDGGVHSHIDHVKALCHLLDEAGITKIHIHAFMDGRDTDPRGGVGYVEELIEDTLDTPASIATMIGRYYAMDRDMRWERIKMAYDLIVYGVGDDTLDDPIEALRRSYDAGVTDEFIKPIVLNRAGLIHEEDAVIFFNFRTDRPRQIVRALTQEAFEDHSMKPLQLYMATMVSYDKTFSGIRVIYTKDNLEATLGEVISAHGLSQLRIAETEKYPHVTFFFNGGRETPFEGEDRIVIPSPKVATYDLAPEMSARGITDAVCQKIQSDTPDFICLNYANADMVGHTGDFDAAMQACAVVDECLKKLIETAMRYQYEVIVIADHGNSDMMVNADGSPHTAHTTNPVPIIYVAEEATKADIRDGKLADVAPTLLGLMGISPSVEMTGKKLVSKI